MNCDHCQNTATIFLTQMDGQSLRKISLCEGCSQDPQIIVSQGLDQILDLPKSLLENPPPQQVAPTPRTSVLSCVCGFSLDDLSRTGRLGCSECYEVFEDVLAERIQSVQRGTEHKGKVIDVPLSNERLEKQHNSLTEQLDLAIQDEQFEKAAQLRDQLNAIKGKLDS